jgi:HEAT repeat protein
MKKFVVVSLSVLVLAASVQRAQAQAPAAGTQPPPAPAPRDPVKDLAGQLGDEDVNVRRAAARALTRMPNTVPAIPRLIEALKDKDPFVRDNAVDALSVMHAGDVVPALTRALRDPDANARRRSADALARIGHDTEPAWPALIDLLKDENAEVRKAATAALRRLMIGRWD